MRPDYNSPEALAPLIEALIFASDEPQSAQSLRSLILGEEQPKTDVNEDSAQAAGEETQNANDLAEAIVETAEASDNGEAIEAESTKKPKQRKKRQLIELTTIHDAVKLLNAQLEETVRPYRIIEIAGGYQFATRSEYSEYVARLFKEKSRRRLSGASLETLAIIAYKQPVSKQDIENIRGVNCDEVLKSLLEKNLVTITGRAEAVGRPLLYGTTTEFLRHFGLPAIGDLPKPREIEELMKEESIKATTLEEAAKEFVDPSLQGEDGVALDEVIAEAKEAEGTNEEVTMEESTSVGGIELDVDAMTSSGDTVELLAAGDSEDDGIVEDEDGFDELDEEDFDEDEIEELDDEDFDEDGEEVLEDEDESKA
jgi:segregation and condensation protein B